VKLVHGLVTAPLALVLVVFAVSNRATVSVTFWPTPFEIDLPLYLVVLVALLLGFLLGQLTAWINGGKKRREAREKGRRVRELESELEASRGKRPEPPFQP
jgi:putative membrane protein